ncbi:MAG: hypothetical protein ACFFC5_07090 [Promethearchaeota archaeon]
MLNDANEFIKKEKMMYRDIEPKNIAVSLKKRLQLKSQHSFLIIETPQGDPVRVAERN